MPMGEAETDRVEDFLSLEKVRADLVTAVHAHRSQLHHRRPARVT